ncbi:MAG: hypothetical protein RL603_1292 [Pseudomonadota bacterium]
MTVAVFFVLGAVATALLTGLALRVAQRKGWVDTPVDRSMHTYATPTGGGVAIVCVVTAALALWIDSFPIVVAALAVAIMGFIDDLRPLPVVPRLIVQGAAIAVGLHSLDALPTLAGFGLTFEPNWVALLILGVACLWHLNLFNFMDGIDGIAAAETTFIGVVAAWLVAERGELSALWAVIGGAGVAQKWRDEDHRAGHRQCTLRDRMHQHDRDHEPEKSAPDIAHEDARRRAIP